MKNNTRIALFIILGSIGYIGLMFIAKNQQQISKRIKYEKCLNYDHSDRGCDSCHIAIYGYSLED